MKVVSLGRPAHIYIPVSKWTAYIAVYNAQVGRIIEDFCTQKYGGYTLGGPLIGSWKKDKDTPAIEEKVVEVKVAFLGKERIPELQEFLAKMCAVIGEQCLYLETGEDSWLIYPNEN